MDVVAKVLPVILLFLLGAFLRRTQFISPSTVQELRKIVINISLPAVLFLAFSKINLQPGYLLIVAIIFTACGLGLLLGYVLRKLFRIPSPFFPMLMTGFEAGMMGYAIYGAVYGAENIYKFGIIDLGQATFVFFVLVTVLGRMGNNTPSIGATVLNFFKTPVILAILGGVLASQTGVAAWMRSTSLMDSLLRTLELIANLTTPLITIYIGYDMRLDWNNLGRPLQSIVLRLLIWVPFGLLLNSVVLDGLLHLDRTFQAALMTMMVLPAPFVIPLFIKEASQKDRDFVVNALSLASLMTLITFSTITFFYKP